MRAFKGDPRWHSHLLIVQRGSSDAGCPANAAIHARCNHSKCAEKGGKQPRVVSHNHLVGIRQVQEPGSTALHFEQGAGQTRLVSVAEDSGHTIRGIHVVSI